MLMDRTKLDDDKIMQIVKEYGTPLYLYDGDIIRKKVRMVKEAFPDFKILYSVKANPALSVCALFKKLALGAEVASLGELHRALKVGISPQEIILVGPGKTIEELDYAVERNILSVVIESLTELERLETVCKRKGRTANVMLRINTKTTIETSPERMVGGPSKFGFDEEDVVSSVKNLNLNCIKIVGIHVYSASQILSVEQIVNQMVYIAHLATKISEDLCFEIRFIDFGGGFGVPYSQTDNELGLKRIKSNISPAIEDIREKHPALCPILELGRYLIAESGIYLARIVDIKKSRGCKYIVVNDGINHFVRPVFMNLNHPTCIINKKDPPMECVSVVGKLCTPFDIIAKDIPLPKPEIGDIVGILCTGAYGFSMSMLNFLSHPWPAEVLTVGHQSHLIRKRGNIESPCGEEVLVDV